MEEYLADNAASVEAEDSAAAVESAQSEPEMETQQTEETPLEEQQEEQHQEETPKQEEETPSGAANTGSDLFGVEKTKAFSRRLNEKTQEAKDSVYAQFGWENPYTGEKITTERQYMEYRRMAEAAQRGMDPIAERRILALEESNRRAQQEAQRMRDSEYDRTLQSDPVYGDIYKELRSQVLQLMDGCRAKGIHVTLQSAFSAIMTNRANFGKILEKERERASQAAIQKMKATGNAQVGALGSETAQKPLDFASMSPEEFEKYVARVKAGEKIRF